MHNKKIIIGGSKLQEVMKTMKMPSDEQRREQLRAVALTVLNTELELNVHHTNIISTSRLGKPTVGSPCDRRPLVLEIDNEFTKSSIFRAFAHKKPKHLYATDFLTRYRRDIMETLLSLKKETTKNNVIC